MIANEYLVGNDTFSSANEYLVGNDTFSFVAKVIINENLSLLATFVYQSLT